MEPGNLPVYLQVRQVRDAIYREGLRSPDKLTTSHQPSNKELGTLFHDAVARLFSSDPERNCASALTLAEQSLESWQATLRKLLYFDSIGPYLASNQAGLRNSSAEILSLWQATENFSVWLAGLLWKAHESLGWPQSETCFVTCEDQMSWDLYEPGWRDSVHLSGVADLVLRVPGKGATGWCVVEFKLGRTSPEADLAQACLYHEMLLSANGDAPDGTLALVSFTPEKHERLYKTPSLTDARAKLKALIGSLAGVAMNGTAAVAAMPHASVPAVVVAPPPRLREMEQALLKTFQEFGAPAERAGDPIAGPVFYRFFFVPARGIRTKKLTTLADELRVRLNLNTSPMIQVMSGRIAVDVQRPDRQPVTFSSVRSQLPSGNGSAVLPVGVDLSGQLVLADLSETKHAHILVVGTTGSGKSEWLRTAIAGLILGNTPQTLQLVLIDPKRTAFNELAGSPFVSNRQIIYPDDQPVSQILDLLGDEMESRYRQMQAAGADDLRGLIAAGIQLPRIVCICDEYANLLTRSKQEKQEIERQISRLGAKARAAGIHLIIATQEARRETIKGSLDANLPARVGLRTLKDIESRVLLGENGTESLLGDGDLLFKDIGSPVRLQAPLLSAEDREEIFKI